MVCRKGGISIKQLASNLEFSNAIKRMGFDENIIELTLKALNSIFTEDRSVSPESAAKIIHQIFYMHMKNNIPLDKFAEEIESKNKELNKIKKEIKENENLLIKSRSEMNAVIQRTNFTIEQMEQWLEAKNALKVWRFDINDVDKLINILKNVRELGSRPTRLIHVIKQYRSVRDRKRDLEQESDILETNLELYKEKEEKEKKYWHGYWEGRKEFDKLTSLGVETDVIFQISKIILRHYPSLSLDELVRDIDTYGGIQAAIFKARRDFQKVELNSENMSLQ